MFGGNLVIPAKEGRLAVAEMACWMMLCLEDSEKQGNKINKEVAMADSDAFLEAVSVETKRRINNHFRSKG